MTLRRWTLYIAVTAALGAITAVSVNGVWRRPKHFALTNAKDCLVAFSLSEAERRLWAHQGVPSPIASLGGMTRLVGLVYDRERRDPILIGRTEASRPPLDLDSLVVAMRAVLVRQQWPLVSVDPTADTITTGQQTVRLEGGIADSRFGQDFLLADVRLKRLGLGLESAPNLENMSYFRHRVERSRRDVRGVGGRSRFWFYAIDPGLEQRDDVFLIRRLALGVRAETKALSLESSDPAFDAAANEFASAVTTSFAELCRKFSDLDRLQSLYEMVAVARGMQMVPGGVSDYWLNRYAVRATPTPRTFAVIGREERVETPHGPRYLEVRGGIQFRALSVRLLDGDVTALKEAVLLSRPGAHELTWFVPIGIDEPVDTSTSEMPEQNDAGSSIDWHVGRDADEAARQKEVLQRNVTEIEKYLKQARPEFLKPLPTHEGGYHSDDGGVTNYRDGSDLENANRSTGQYHSSEGGRTHYLNGSTLEKTANSPGMYHTDDNGLTFKLNESGAGEQTSASGFLCVTASCVGPKQTTSDGMKAEPYFRADLSPYSLHRFVDAGYTVSRDGKVVGSGYGDVKLLGGGAFAAKEWNGPGYEIHDSTGKSISKAFASVEPIGETGYFAVPNEGGLGMTTVYDSHIRAVRAVPSTDLNSYLQGVDFASELKSHYTGPDTQKVGGIKADITVTTEDFDDRRRKK